MWRESEVSQAILQCTGVHLRKGLHVSGELLSCSADTIHALTAASTRWPKWKENTLHTRHTIGIPSAYTFTRFHQLMQAPIGPRCLIFVSSRGAKLFFARVKSMASRFTQSKTHPRWQGGDTGYSKKRWHEIGMAAWPHGHCPSRCSALVQARMANGTNGTNGTSESNGPSTFKSNKSVSAK